MFAEQLSVIKISILLTVTLLFISYSWSEGFIITYWCGPPLKETTLERYKEIKEAGFNIAFVSIDGAFKKEDNLRLLDIASKVGLKCIIADTRLTWDLPSKDNWQKILDEIIKDYASHPALFGYFLMDEPNAAHFPMLGQLVAYIKEKDPKHLAYINLFPDYATPQQLGTSIYREHVEKFVEIVKPQLLSYDYYTFLEGADRDTFFLNLRVIMEASKKARIPFLVIIQMLPHGPYRDLTKGEIAWQAFHCLAYGAKGISYFTYWTPPDDPIWHPRNGIISWEGERTSHYYEVQEVNKEVKVLGDFLYNLQAIDAYHIGEVPKGGKPLPPGTPIKSIEGGNATVGFFKDSRKTYYCLLVNMDYRNSRNFEIHLDSKNVQIYDTKAKKWIKTSSYEQNKDRYIKLTLPPGWGVLLKL
ncbi:hypothetical protein H5T87_05350 [bacterium]|nr:hypothetical protein [bacterium]